MKSLFTLLVLNTLLILPIGCATRGTNHHENKGARTPTSISLPFFESQTIALWRVTFTDGLISYDPPWGETAVSDYRNYRHSEVQWTGKYLRLRRSVTIGSLLNRQGRVTMKEGKLIMIEPFNSDNLKFPIKINVNAIHAARCEDGNPSLEIERNTDDRRTEYSHAYFNSPTGCKAAAAKMTKYGANLIIPDLDGKQEITIESNLK